MSGEKQYLRVAFFDLYQFSTPASFTVYQYKINGNVYYKILLMSTKHPTGQSFDGLMLDNGQRFIEWLASALWFERKVVDYEPIKEWFNAQFMRIGEKAPSQ